MLHIFPLDTPGMYGRSWLLWRLRSVLADIHRILKTLSWLHIFPLDTRGMLRTLCCFHIFQQGMADTH